MTTHVHIEPVIQLNTRAYHTTPDFTRLIALEELEL